MKEEYLVYIGLGIFAFILIMLILKQSKILLNNLFLFRDKL